MNMMQTLLRDHSRAMRDKIVAYVGHDKTRFATLVHLFLGGPYRITQRAAWPLSHCVEKHPNLIKPHLKKIIRNLSRPGLHDAVNRNTMRLLQFIYIPVALQGEIAALAFDMLSNRKEPIAVRVFAMSTLAKIAKDHPGLRSELRIILEDQLPYASPGVSSRARKILLQLTKMPGAGKGLDLSQNDRPNYTCLQKLW